MLKLRTKTNFPIPTKRGSSLGVIRFIIDKIEVDENNITAIGYYYYLDENSNVFKLDKSNNIKLWEEVTQIEAAYLPEFVSKVSLKENILQRLNEFTNLQMTTESGENFGTFPEDWEIDN